MQDSPFGAPTGRAMDSVLDSTARINIWHGSVRSAKTITSAFRWYEFVTRQAHPSAPLLMAGQTERTLYRNVVEPMEQMYPGRVHLMPGTGSVSIGGRTVYLQGAGDVRGERKLRGLTLGGAYVDEATVIPEDFWNRVTDRLSAPGAKLFATTNPDSPRHWLKLRWLDRAEELDLASFHFTLDDNPWLPDEYVAALKLEHVGVWHRRYILGEWVAAEGAVWPQLDLDKHVVDDVPMLQQQLLAVDYGTSNPTHVLLLGIGQASQKDPPRVYVAREWRWDSRLRGRQLTDTEQSQMIAEWVAGGCASPAWQQPAAGPLEHPMDVRWRIVDPSATSLIVQLGADKQPGVQGADNRVEVGLRAVGSLLAADRLRIHSSCRDLLAEMQGYGWDEKALGRGVEQPMKVADHGPDALRYGTMRLWGTWRSWLATGGAFAPPGG